MSTWPNTLPEPDADGYREAPPVLALRTAMDAGPAKMRRRFTAAAREVAFTLSGLTRDQVDDLDEFYLATTLGGTTAFDWTHPITAASVSARFVAPPQYEGGASDEDWRASVRLEVLP